MNFLDRVLESFTTTGVGTVSLAGPATGFRGFVAALGGGGTVFYFMIGAPGSADANNWEFGYGVLTDASPDTLTRNLIASSTGALISWASGTKYAMSAPIASVMNGMLSSFRGTTAPAYPRAGMIWEDTSAGAGLTRLKIYDGADWIWLCTVDETNNLVSPFAWNVVLDDAFEDLASAATTNLLTPLSRNVRITGTTTITAFGTVKAGSIRHLRFAGALTLTHNATSLILPGGANITTAADDTATFISLGAGNWLCLAYKRASGLAVVTAVGTEVQKVRTELTSTLDAQGGVASTFYAVTGLTATITPASGNDVRVRGFLSVSANAAGCWVGIRIKRDTTVLLAGAAAGSRLQVHTSALVGVGQIVAIPFDILDVAPGTSAFVYSVEAVVDQAQTFNVNKSDADADSAAVFRTVSLIEAVEIKR